MGAVSTSSVYWLHPQSDLQSIRVLKGGQPEPDLPSAAAASHAPAKRLLQIRHPHIVNLLEVMSSR